MSRKDELPESGLMYVRPGEVDALAPAYDFIPDLLHDGTVAMIYGAPGSGKTFFAIHLLCTTALGLPTFGVTPEKRNGLYIALEGEAGIKARIMAWGAQNDVDSSPIHYALGRFSIAGEGDKDVSDLIDYMRRHRIGFVVIDTWSLAMAGLDEISGQHMSAGLDALHRIKRETGACVVAIAHTGKNEKAGIRGHSSQLGNVDTTIELVCHNRETVHEGNKTRIIEHEITLATPRSAIVRKQRDGEGGKRVHFTLALQNTPFRDARGNVLRRPAVCERDAFPELPADEDDIPQPRPLTARESEAADILARLNRTLGRAGPATMGQFRNALKRAGWGPENSGSWRRAFHDLKNHMETDSNDAVLHLV